MRLVAQRERLKLDLAAAVRRAAGGSAVWRSPYATAAEAEELLARFEAGDRVTVIPAHDGEGGLWFQWGRSTWDDSEAWAGEPGEGALRFAWTDETPWTDTARWS